MTSIGAGLRLATNLSVPAEFAHGHMTENLALDPSDGSPHTAWFDDNSSQPSTRIIEICIDHPEFGVMVLGYLELDDGADDRARRGHADGQVGAGLDYARGGYDPETGRRPEDEYLQRLMENGGRPTQAPAGPGTDHGSLRGQNWLTFAEAARNVRAVLDDSNHLSTIKPFLYTPDTAAIGDYIVEPRNSSIPHIQLAAFKSSDQDEASDQGDKPGNVSENEELSIKPDGLNQFGFSNDPFTGQPSVFFPPIAVAPLAGAAAVGVVGTTAAILPLLLLPEGGAALEIGGALDSAFTPAELGVINEARSILTSPEMANLARAYTRGESLSLKIGGRLIQYEPGLPASGMTMFGEDGFLIGPEAFSSDIEISQTVLHELYRLMFSRSATGLSGELAAQETNAAAEFAARAVGQVP